jgi:hypothetical protein
MVEGTATRVTSIKRQVVGPVDFVLLKLVPGRVLSCSISKIPMNLDVPHHNRNSLYCSAVAPFIMTGIYQIPMGFNY